MRKWIAGAALIGSTLSAQTIGPIAREGRYWVREQTALLPGTTRLRLDAPGGIVVVGREAPDMECVVRLRVKAPSQERAEEFFRQAAVETRARGPVALVSILDPGCGRCAFSAETEVRVPLATDEAVVRALGGVVKIQAIRGRVRVDSLGGAMDLGPIGGSLWAKSAGGPIRLGAIGGDVFVESGGGAIDLDQARGSAELKTGGGEIRVGRVGGDLRAETDGGGITVEDAGGMIRALTGGGSIRIDRAGGMATLETAGGSIRVGQAERGLRAETPMGRIQVEDVAGGVFASTMSGDIEVALASSGTSQRDSLIESMGGSIVAWLPTDIRLRVEAIVELAAGSRRIQSDFGQIVVGAPDGRFGMGDLRAAGALNGGGAVLRLKNMDGKIEIRRR